MPGQQQCSPVEDFAIIMQYLIYRTVPKSVLKLLDCYEELLAKLQWLQTQCGNNSLSVVDVKEHL